MINRSEQDKQLDRIFEEVPRHKTPKNLTRQILKSVHVEAQRRQVSSIYSRPKKKKRSIVNVLLGVRVLHYAEAAALFLIIVLGLAVLQEPGQTMHDFIYGYVLPGNSSPQATRMADASANSAEAYENIAAGAEADSFQMKSYVGSSGLQEGRLYDDRDESGARAVTSVSTADGNGQKLLLLEPTRTSDALNKEQLLNIIKSRIFPSGPELSENYQAIFDIVKQQVESQDGIVKSWSLIDAEGDAPDILHITCMSPISKTTQLKQIFSENNIIVPEDEKTTAGRRLSMNNPFTSKLVMSTDLQDAAQESSDRINNASIKPPNSLEQVVKNVISDQVQATQPTTTIQRINHYKHTINFTEFYLLCRPVKVKLDVDPSK